MSASPCRLSYCQIHLDNVLLTLKKRPHPLAQTILRCRKEEAGGTSQRDVAAREGIRPSVISGIETKRAKHVTERDAYEAFLDGLKKRNHAVDNKRSVFSDAITTPAIDSTEALRANDPLDSVKAIGKQVSRTDLTNRFHRGSPFSEKPLLGKRMHNVYMLILQLVQTHIISSQNNLKTQRVVIYRI